MFIDKVLAGFKIQTKVLLFVLPFVVSICAVGFTGLYASGMLQGRMEISNSVLQSLSGFKNVYSGMSTYLQHTTEENRKTVTETLQAQQVVLDDTMAQVTDPQGQLELKHALDGAAAIGTRIDALWALNQKELDTRKAISDSLARLLGEQMSVLETATKMEREVRQQEGAAKSLLREAERLIKASETLTEQTALFNKATTPESKFDAVAGNVGNLGRVSNMISSGLPANQKAVAETFRKTLGEIKALVAAGDKSADGVATLGKLVSRFRQTSIQLQGAGGLKMREATLVFRTLDNQIVKAESVLSETRNLINSVYSIRIAAASFLETANTDGRERLEREVAIMAKDLETLSGTAGDIEFFRNLVATLRPLLDTMLADSQVLVESAEKRQAEFAAAAADIDAVWKQLTVFAESQKTSAATESDSANQVSVAATAIGILIAMMAGGALVLTLKTPISQITAAMRRLAEGALDTRIDGEARRDEIGEMARALSVFKENALSKVRIETESAEQRRSSEAERARNDAEKQTLDRQIDVAVAELAAGLGRLAQGDLTRQIEIPFSGRLEQLRVDFNGSLVKLQDTLTQIRDNAGAIQRSGGEMNGAANALSKRTEAQAASLEEAAAAVEQITVTVRSSANRAAEANMAVAETKRSADGSTSVVNNAIAAMGRIEEASNKIEQIIEVIDEIAFQTNLLALNAGIEAARAGEAGKGFAVVAQEVRELAQRSAGAAKEIKTLINRSTEEVTSGSNLVRQTGAVLASISQQITAVSQHVDMIATASRDQAAALQDVNGSVNQMDQMTQQNAAMVEQTSAASRQLANQADTLMTLVEQFRLSGERASGRPARMERAA